jgi:ACS family hexuronate transporter-like MFS transporter
VILGAAEAGLLPASMYALVVWFPKTRIGTAGSIRNAFQALGPILCTPLVVAITLAYGWRHAFILPGAIGIVFGILWFISDTNPPRYRDRVEPPKKQITVMQVLTSHIIWGVLLARIISDPLWFFLQYWQAGYLQEKLGFSLAQVGWVLWIPPLFSAVMVFLAGLYSDRLIARFGWLQARSRIRILQGAACLSPLILVIPYLDNVVLVIALLSIAYFIANIWLVFTNILATDLFRSTGGGMATAVGVVNALGTAGAAISQPYIGMALDSVGYLPVFFALACIHPIAAVLLQLFYRPQLRAATAEPAIA